MPPKPHWSIVPSLSRSSVSFLAYSSTLSHVHSLLSNSSYGYGIPASSNILLLKKNIPLGHHLPDATPYVLPSMVVISLVNVSHFSSLRSNRSFKGVTSFNLTCDTNQLSSRVAMSAHGSPASTEEEYVSFTMPHSVLTNSNSKLYFSCISSLRAACLAPKGDPSSGDISHHAPTLITLPSRSRISSGSSVWSGVLVGSGFSVGSTTGSFLQPAAKPTTKTTTIIKVSNFSRPFDIINTSYIYICFLLKPFGFQTV